MVLIQALDVFPKPLDLFVFERTVFVVGRAFPFLNIDVLRSIQKHLHFKRLKWFQKTYRHDFFNTFSDSFDIMLTGVRGHVIYQKVNELIFVVISD